MAYWMTLVRWIQVEQIAHVGNRRDARQSRNEATVNKNAVERSGEYIFQWEDVRTALFFLFFVQVGFFGTGK